MTESELSEDWAEVPFQELLSSMESGSRPSGGVRGIAAGVPSVGGEHLNSEGGFNFDSIRYVPRSFYESMRRGHIKPGDVLIVKDGATTGKVALVSDDFPFDEAVVNEHVFVCRPRSVDSDYVSWFLRSAEGQRRILEHFKGSAQGGITQDFAAGTMIPVAPPKTQRAIAHFLGSAEMRRTSARRHLAAAQKATVNLRQAVLAAASSGRLTASWRAARPHANVTALIGRLASARLEVQGGRAKPPATVSEADLPEIPETWTWLSVDSLSRAVVDGVHKTPTYVDQGIPFLTVRNLTAGAGISFENCKYISAEDHKAFTARTKPQRGDILISKDGTIGVTRAVRTDQEFSIFVSVAMVKPLLYEMSDYMEIALSSPQLQRQMVGVGSGLVHLVLRDLKADAIPVPPLEEQAEIVQRVNRLLKIAEQAEDRVESAKLLTERSWQALMTKAFRGELGSNSNGLGKV